MRLPWWLVLALIAMTISGVWRVVMKLCVQKTGWGPSNVAVLCAEIAFLIPLFLVTGRAKGTWVWPWWGYAALAGAFGAANGLITTYALKTGPAGIIGVVQSASPILTLALGVAFLKEEMNWRQAVGASLALAGLLLLVWATPRTNP